MAAEKDTIYIDVDDEITSIIEKVKKGKSDIVALVLPKRAVVLQSIVNMKLLKKSADGAGKRVVLITSEAGLLPLAGAVGLYVAKNLQSKPEVPVAPDMDEPDDDEIEAELDDEEEPEIDKAVAVGALAASKADTKDDIPTIDESDEVADGPVAAAASKAKKQKQKAKKDKSKRVPNFEKFRLKFFLIIGGVILLIVFWWWAVMVAPQLKAVIVTDSTTSSPSVTFTADPDVTEVDLSKNVVQAKRAEKTEEDDQTAAATGTKDVGTKATGTLNMSVPCSPQTPPTIPAGTKVSANGLTFVTATATSLTTPNFSNGCRFGGSTKITAEKNGEEYNLGATSYAVTGYPTVSSEGTAMTGGTSKTIKVVSDQDVESAKGKLTDNSDKIKAELRGQLEEEGYVVIDSSFDKDVDTTVSPAVGQEANEVTVRAKTTYSMYAVKQDQLHQLVEEAVKPELEASNQQMQDDGIATATFEIDKKGSDTIKMTMQTTVQIGPKVDEAQLKSEIAGQKRGDTENIIKNISGVKDVELDYSPFWVSRTPKNADKITVEYKKAGE